MAVLRGAKLLAWRGRPRVSVQPWAWPAEHISSLCEVCTKFESFSIDKYNREVQSTPRVFSVSLFKSKVFWAHSVCPSNQHLQPSYFWTSVVKYKQKIVPETKSKLAESSTAPQLTDWHFINGIAETKRSHWTRVNPDPVRMAGNLSHGFVVKSRQRKLRAKTFVHTVVSRWVATHKTAFLSCFSIFPSFYFVSSFRFSIISFSFIVFLSAIFIPFIPLSHFYCLFFHHILFLTFSLFFRFNCMLTFLDSLIALLLKKHIHRIFVECNNQLYGLLQKLCRLQ